MSTERACARVLTEGGLVGNVPRVCRAMLQSTSCRAHRTRPLQYCSKTARRRTNPNQLATGPRLHFWLRHPTWRVRHWVRRSGQNGTGIGHNWALGVLDTFLMEFLSGGVRVWGFLSGVHLCDPSAVIYTIHLSDSGLFPPSGPLLVLRRARDIHLGYGCAPHFHDSLGLGPESPFIICTKSVSSTDSSI